MNFDPNSPVFLDQQNPWSFCAEATVALAEAAQLVDRRQEGYWRRAAAWLSVQRFRGRAALMGTFMKQTSGDQLNMVKLDIACWALAALQLTMCSKSRELRCSKKHRVTEGQRLINPYGPMGIHGCFFLISSAGAMTACDRPTCFTVFLL